MEYHRHLLTVSIVAIADNTVFRTFTKHLAEAWLLYERNNAS